jgi:type III restriction enzyme
VPRKTSRPSPDQGDILKARVTTAPCVPEIRKAVEEWRNAKYRGATATTEVLLNYWFGTDHRISDGGKFQYYSAQREAIETLIWLYEVEEVRRHRDLVERFAKIPGIHVLQYDDFARYAVKMATGSGKTKVMALAVAWQYFNAVAEARDDFAKTFLVIAPNVIVFERLRADFGGGRIFRTDPIIPPELRIFWEMDFYMRGDPEGASSQGALYLTNVQQLYERKDADDSDEPDVMTDVLGPIPPSSATPEIEDFELRIAARSAPALVINDEGHHVHDEENEWSKGIRRLNDASPAGITGQFDFTATPRYQKGGLFTWTVFDYPLKQAIIDRIVKRPMKGVTAGLDELRSDVASVKYQGYLTAGVERWREYRDQLEPLGKKPILFVMMNSTAEADDVADYLRVKYPTEFGASATGSAQLLVIHTDRSGEVSKKDLDAARVVARRVDEGQSPVNAIVSVLMLREGWDVQNVTVIVGLRPYTSKANILPEQTIGRGLRLMFTDSPSYVERVDVIGNPAFLKFVEQLEKDEDITLDTFDLKEPVVITTIEPDENKLDHDITVPVLSPILSRKKTLAEEIEGIDVSALTCPRLPKREGDKASEQFHYEGVDIITLQKLVEREYTIPQPQTAEEVISYYAKRIAQDVKLPSQFAGLVPKVRGFLRDRAFGESVDLADKAIISAIATSVAQYVTVKTFATVLRALVVEELSPTLEHSGRGLSETEPFPFSRPTFEASKTVFNLVAPDNDFEREFAQFLQDSPDVASFAKLPRRFRFVIEYTDAATNLRYYEPDFVAVDRDDVHYVIETKGQENVDVEHKDRAAMIWCENATLLTDTTWSYIKVPQSEFNKLQPRELTDVRVAFSAGG